MINKIDVIVSNEAINTKLKGLNEINLVYE